MSLSDFTDLAQAAADETVGGGAPGAVLDLGRDLSTLGVDEDDPEEFAEVEDRAAGSSSASLARDITAYVSESAVPEEDEQQQVYDEPIVARRPAGGIIVDPGSHATLEVVVQDGDETRIPLVNSCYPRGLGPGTANFLISQFNEANTSAAAVRRTLNSFYITTTARNPRVAQVGGVLIDSDNFPWVDEWNRNWSRYIEGSKCLQNRALVYLTVADRVFRGIILSSSMNRTAVSNHRLAQFNFEMVLTEEPRSLAFDRRVEKWETNDNSPIHDLYRARGALAQLNAEIVQGSIGDLSGLPAKVSLQQIPQPRQVVNNLDEVLAHAAEVNRIAGRQIYDLNNLRETYIAQLNASTASYGASAPLTGDAAAESMRDTSGEYRNEYEHLSRLLGADSADAFDSAARWWSR
jgi:hypothetical protein